MIASLECNEKGVRRVSTLALNVRRWNASKTLYCGLWTAHKLNEVEQTIFAREIISPCFSSGSTDSLFQALSKWERVKTKQNKQLQAGTRFSLRSFSLNGSLEQTFKRPLSRPFFPPRTARRESTLDRWDLLYKFTKRCLWNLTHVYYFSRETLFIGN